MDWPLLTSLDEILLQVQMDLPGKVLFWGERSGALSSYVAGWMTGKGMDVIVLDGANRFNPYVVSSYARRALIRPEDLLKKIRSARAFTCYQMATLIEEKLAPLLTHEKETDPIQKRWVILLGWITPFLDVDVPDREVRPLFERSLRSAEKLSAQGTPFFLFQPQDLYSYHPSSKGKEFFDLKRSYLAKRLSQFSDLIWKVDWDDEGPKMNLEKSPTALQATENRPQIAHRQ
jgi:hypothetical protein